MQFDHRLEGQTRRKFLKTSLAASVLTTLGKAETEESYDGLRAELNTILASRGFDGISGTGVVLAIISDPHIFLGNDYPSLVTEKWEDDLINELNGLQPPITHLILAGDLISHHSMTPGSPAYGIHEQWSLQEFALAKNEVARFNMPMWMIPGNHDTYAYETDAEMFQEQMGVPPYQRIELGGVPIFLLNTGNAGMLNPAQEAWLRAEAATVPADRDILIVQHIPTFSVIYTQAGSKRIIAEAFSNRTAPVYIASGHNHRFDEGVTAHNGTRFVQMATTTANRVVFNDKKNPGYLVLGLQDGMVKARVQRSLTVAGFWARPPVESLPTGEVRFPFDSVTELISAYEEGFYDRNGTIEFSGVHVGCYISYCKWATVKITPKSYYGGIRRFIVSGLITAAAQPTCSISSDGPEGPWNALEFPTAKGSGLYEVAIPESYADASEIHIKVDTGLTSSVQGFSWSGWAIASDSATLSGYEKWLLGIYGTLLKTEANSPESIALGGAHENLLTFAFNLQPYQRGTITGLPSISSDFPSNPERRIVVRYTRILNIQEAGLRYRIEASDDLAAWTEIDISQMDETITEQDDYYEQVCVFFPIEEAASSRFYRVTVEHVGKG